ncbi:MAG: peptidylprolyl isomerase [Vicinamibacteria bacterium]
MLTIACLLHLLVPPAAGDVLATYQGGTVTRAEYETWLLGQARKQKDDPDARRAALESIALSESLESAARAAGLDRQPRTAFRLAQVESGLLAAALRQATDRAIVVTEAEVEAELKAEDKERYKPRTWQLRNIFKRVPAGAPDAARAQARERMESIRKELAAGASFDDLAWSESDSQTRFRGGAMGYVRAGVLSPHVDKVVAGLKKGELSAVLESADGFTILRCDDIDEGRVIPVDEARKTIRLGLWHRASYKRQAELRADLLREAAPRFADAPSAEDAAAVEFKDGRITEAELRWLAGGSPEDPLPPETRRNLLEEQVLRVVGAARARAQGLDQDPALRARAAWQRASILATEEIARRIDRSAVKPTPEEMRAHFERTRERHLSPLKVDISIIVWPVEPGQLRRQLEEGEALVNRLRTGEADFDATARQTSVDRSAAKGGRLGLHAMTDLNQLGPNVYRTIESLGPGETSPVIQHDATLYVVKLWERQPPRPLTYDEAAPAVEQELGNARVAERQKERTAEARKALAFALTETAPAP